MTMLKKIRKFLTNYKKNKYLRKINYNLINNNLNEAKKNFEKYKLTNEKLYTFICAHLSTNEKYISFFENEIKKNKKALFNYCNYLNKNHKYDLNIIDLINTYFENKNLVGIKKIDNMKKLYVSNILENKTLEKTTTKLKVSIVLTVFNCEDLLETSINSLLNQTYTNIELILVNDNSKDKSYKIIEKFKNNKIIKIINLKKNHGTYVAKNIGITFATGDLITFHDSDDWAHPQRIEEHVNAHNKKDIKYTISKLIRISEEGNFYSKYIYPLDRLSMVSLMIDRKIINEIGYFRTHRLGSDTEYFERLKIFTSHKFGRIDKVLMFCSHRENSLTTDETTGIIGFSKTNKRQHYWNQWNKWHKKLLKMKRKPFVKFDREKYEYEIIN